MPLLRCTDPECGHRFIEPSRFATQCIECGADAVPVDDAEDERPQELLAVPGRPGHEERAHPAHARVLARRVLAAHRITRPPVPVPAIARRESLTIVERDDLGALSARLIDDRIELAAHESENAKRFSIAHELGHHFLRTQHDSGSTVEEEANAFAGELLVPGHFLSAALERTTSLEQLRREFRVSRDVLEIAARHHRVFDRLT
jgi:hypothetical protein